MGPTGVGGAYIKNPDFVDSVIVGGGGDNSVATVHPKSLPEKFSPGTMNSTGIIGLSAGIEYIYEIGLDKIRTHTNELMQRCCDKIANLDRNVEIVAKHDNSTPILLLKIPGLLSLDISKRLSEEYGIATRGGLHCAPIAHKSLGTYPNGALRISFGYSNTSDDVDYFIKGLRKLLS